MNNGELERQRLKWENFHLDVSTEPPPTGIKISDNKRKQAPLELADSVLSLGFTGDLSEGNELSETPNYSLCIGDITLIKQINYLLSKNSEIYKKTSFSNIPNYDGITAFDGGFVLNENIYSYFDELMRIKIRALHNLGLVGNLIETINELDFTARKIVFAGEKQALFFEVIDYLCELEEFDHALKLIDCILVGKDQFVKELRIKFLDCKLNTEDEDKFGILAQNLAIDYDSRRLEIINNRCLASLPTSNVNDLRLATSNLIKNISMPALKPVGDISTKVLPDIYLYHGMEECLGSNPFEVLKNISLAYSLFNDTENLKRITRFIANLFKKSEAASDSDLNEALAYIFKAGGIVMINTYLFTNAIKLFDSLDGKNNTFEIATDGSIIVKQRISVEVAAVSNTEENDFANLICQLGSLTAFVGQLSYLLKNEESETSRTGFEVVRGIKEEIVRRAKKLNICRKTLKENPLDINSRFSSRNVLLSKVYYYIEVLALNQDDFINDTKQLADFADLSKRLILQNPNYSERNY